jgi:hypothetical protein
MLHVVVSRFQHDVPGVKVILYQGCDISRVGARGLLSLDERADARGLWQQRHGWRENHRI